jgi:hypothetical protein
VNPTRIDEVIGILQEVKHFVELPDTDVAWSRYNSVEEAVEDIDQHIESLRRDDLSKIEELTLLFAPTGRLQEISIGSGWGEEFVYLSARFDRAIEPLRPR